MESIGFKEWALVCDALGCGEQSILIRKGGIAEGRDGFAFKHPEFFLFPTFFHEQVEKVRRADAKLPLPQAGRVTIRFFAKVKAAHVITRWETAEALEPLHVLKRDVVRERFDYDDTPGIHVALVRVFRLQPAWGLADERRFGGCRSWVDLPQPSGGMTMEPVLTDAEHARRLERFKALVGLTSCSGGL